MIDRFPDNPNAFADVLDTFIRDDEERREFLAAKDALYAQITLLHSGNIHESLEDSIAKLAELLDEHVDQFIALSHTILSRTDKNVAVGEWAKLAKADDVDQQGRVFKLTGLELVPPVQSESLPKYAWSYIKQYGLDTYDEHRLDSRTELDDEQLIVQGYTWRQQHRVLAVMEYAPAFVVAAVDESDLGDN